MSEANAFPNLFFVLDVESIGLHGEGLAAAFCVVDGNGAERAHAVYACQPSVAQGTDDDRAWVAANVPAITLTHQTPAAVRFALWQAWTTWRARGAVMVADCPWPVEANFLAAAVREIGEAARCLGPYPLIDLASVALARGSAPLERVPRLTSELPAHHPLNDARHSGRILADALRKFAVPVSPVARRA